MDDMPALQLLIDLDQPAGSAQIALVRSGLPVDSKRLRAAAPLARSVQHFRSSADLQSGHPTMDSLPRVRTAAAVVASRLWLYAFLSLLELKCSLQQHS
jgi:hypothetical protein